MQETLLAIAGKPGLFKLVARGNGNLIVEALDATRRRTTAGARDRVTSLGDVTMYTEADDVPLMQVFQNISTALGGQPTAFTHKSATEAELESFMTETALPAWDRGRVHNSDIRKLIQWYNLLVQAGYTEFVAPQDEASEEAAATSEAAE